MNLVQKLTPVLIVIAVVGIGVAAIFGFKYYQAQQQLKSVQTDPSSAQQLAADQAKQLVAQVGKLIDLPQGEEPTVATITDISKLKDQPFFAQGKNGDKVLIYTNSKKAYLYDPVANKIIDVAPVNIGSSSAQQTPAQPNIVLENGTTTADLDSKVETAIKKAYPNVNISSKINAKNSYDTTLVVPVSDNAKDAANSLANTLKAQVGTLPKGETQPQGADIVVFVGKDQS